MKKPSHEKRERTMLWIVGSIIFLIITVTIWFYIPYSPVKSKFQKTVNKKIKKSKKQSGYFTKEELSYLPQPVQKYFEYAGFLGKKKMSFMKAFYRDVDFLISPDFPKLNIQYTQYNFVDEPERFALIDTKLIGIPFESLDTFESGEGSVKGFLGKVIPICNEEGLGLDQTNLLSLLSECLLVPSLVLQDFIEWEEIDETHAKATISYYGIKASGVFTFDQNGAMLRFTTDDRENVDEEGNIQKVKWSIICGNYQERNGYTLPTTFQAVWHYDEGDRVYFDGKNIEIMYGGFGENSEDKNVNPVIPINPRVVA